MTRPWVAIGMWLAGAALLVWILFAQDWSTLGPAFAGVGWSLVAIVAAQSGASVLVNVTLTVMALLVFILLGLGAAALSGPASPGLTSIVGGVAVGIVAVCGFVAVQRIGLSGRGRAAIRSRNLTPGATELHER